MLFGAWGIFYIIGGIIIYAFLAESLFRQPKGWSIFVYIIFEVLQIGFYIALIILSFGELFLPDEDNDSGPSTTPTIIKSSTTKATTTTKNSGSKLLEDIFSLPSDDADSDPSSTSDSSEAVNTFGWIMFIISLFLLLLLKTYFIRVFIRYYKFITYQERHSSELRAEYINGRGVHMGFPINPEFDNPIVNDPSYGYSIFPNTRLPELPTYHEAMSTSKHPIPPTAPSPTPGQSFSSHNHQDPPHNPEDPPNNSSSHGYQNSDVP